MTRTPQEVFDFVTSSVIAQGCQSVEVDGMCVYRNAYGLKCAAGFLIPDELYDPSFEGRIILDLALWSATGLPKTHDYLDLARRLQSAHDQEAGRAGFVADFTSRANAVAAELGLRGIPA